jgi:ankyrin repeat protein
MESIQHNNPVQVSLVQAIQTGDVDALRQLLEQYPGLALKRVVDNQGVSRSALHVVSDWPGYFPNGSTIVKMLIEAGADPNASIFGVNHTETPLHWAASSDDADVAVALIDGGADIDKTGGSIAGGTPLDNAVGYGCWNVARLLVQHGAKVDKLWHAAALGMISRMEELMNVNPSLTSEELNSAFWQACHGGQRKAAEFLLARGADINGVPWYTKDTPLDAAGGCDTRRNTMVAWLKSQGGRYSKA